MHVYGLHESETQILREFNAQLWSARKWRHEGVGARPRNAKRPLGKKKRSIDEQMSLDELEEAQLEYDHNLNLKSLQYAFDQLKVDENAEEADRVKRAVTRKPHMKRMKLTLNVGAFIRKAIRNGRDKTMSTYWSYKGSLTTPSEYQ